MSLPLAQAIKDNCPTAGTPDGFHTPYDEALWNGWDRHWTVSAHVVSVFHPSCGRDVEKWQRGVEHDAPLYDVLPNLHPWRTSYPVGYRGTAPLQLYVLGNEVVKVVPGSVLAPIYGDVQECRKRRQGKNPLTARQMVQMLRTNGAIVLTPRRRVTWVRTSKQTALYRTVWAATWKVAYMCYDPDAAGAPGIWERVTKRGSLFVHMLSELRGRRRARERVLWFFGARWLARWRESGKDDAEAPRDQQRDIPGLTDEQRNQLGGLVINEIAKAIRNPPNWQWWAGTQSRPRRFIHFDEFTGNRKPRPVLSFVGKPSCARTIIDQFVDPECDAVQQANLGYSAQQSFALEKYGGI